MTVKVIDALADLQPFRAQWNALAKRTPSATVFQTFEWLDAWRRAYGEGQRLRVVLVLDGDTLVAAAPLMTHETHAYGRPRTALGFAGGMQTDYCDLLYADAAGCRRLLDAIRSDVEWDLLTLTRIPDTSPTVAALGARYPGWRGAFAVSDVCPAYVFDDAHTGADVLGKQSVRRHVAGFHKAGAVDVRHLTSAADVMPHLDDFFQQHIDRRADTTVPSNFLDERACAFYRNLTGALAAQGSLAFTVLSLDGKAAAYHFGFIYRRRLIWYKPSFAPHLARLSPGEVLLASLFELCRSRNLAELDFTVGDEAFKTRFSNARRHNVRFRAFRSMGLQALDSGTRLLKARAKRVKAVERLVRALRERA